MNNLAVCMITKDEELNIGRCIESVAGIADEIIVVDTGSRDSTAEIAEAAGARVFSHEWREDFSEARNFALDQASCEWSLNLDADEALRGPDPKHISNLLSDPSVDAYYCQIDNLVRPNALEVGDSHKFLRLFRRNKYRYVGAVHEGPEPEGRTSEPAWSGLYILHWGYTHAALISKKAQRNLRILENDLKENPNNCLTHFYLGGAYQELGKFEEALKHYKRAESDERPGRDGYQAMVLLSICNCLYRTGQLDEAVMCAEYTLEVFPDYRDMLYLAGEVYAAKKMWEQALSCFEQCAKMNAASSFYLQVQRGLDKSARHKVDTCRAQLLESSS